MAGSERGAPVAVPPGSAPAAWTGDRSEDEDDDDVLGARPAPDEEWDDWAGSDEQDDEPTRSLFLPSVLLPSPEAAMDHDAREFQFDLRQFILQAGLDDYGVIQVINFIRAGVVKGDDVRAALANALSTSSKPWATDAYLLPVLPDDPLLTFDYEEWTQRAAHAPEAAAGGASPLSQGATSEPSPVNDGAAGAAASEASQLRAENAALREEVAALRGALQALQAAARDLAGWDDADDSASPVQRAPAGAGAGSSSTGPGASGRAANGGGAGRRRAQESGAVWSAKEAAAKQVDDSYFDSYSGFGIHREMISDKARTDAYRDALEGNPSLLTGATVLDVGCGTGILSLFACRAGATRVIAVDGSSHIAGFARQVAAAAGYGAEQGGPMHVIASRIEQLSELPGGIDKVDVIISEWMGYGLLFETMLDSVLAARDRWLRPGGAVLPDIATIYLAGAAEPALGLGFWKDVYGFSMAPIASELRGAQVRRANVLHVDAGHITTNAVTAKVLDLCTMEAEDQDFSCEFTLRPASDGNGGGSSGDTASQQPADVAAIVLWFDMRFSERCCLERPVTLSTAPGAPSTHWAQTVLPLDTPVALAAAGAPQSSGSTATELHGWVSMSRNTRKHRSLDIALEYRAEMGDGSVVRHARIYSMDVLGASD